MRHGASNANGGEWENGNRNKGAGMGNKQEVRHVEQHQAVAGCSRLWT